MLELHTTLGPQTLEDVSLILPHEHVFVDLGPIEARSYERATTKEVVPVMTPWLEAAKNAGVSALIECTPVGVGRRVDIVKAVSEAAALPVAVATGIYREPWVPDWAQAASEDELRDWMVGELETGIASTGVRAAFIKLSAGDDGVTARERRILRAAGRAGAATGAAIGSHTIRGRVVLEQLETLAEVGFPAERFIWIHTQAEADVGLHLEVARRGAWLEFDALGSEEYSDDYFLERTETLTEAGFGNRLLLSHDRGWYDPSQPGGGEQRPYTYLSETFLARLRRAGLDEASLEQLVRLNPFAAFAR